MVTYSSFISQPIKFLPNFLAAIAVVPIPIKQSNIKSPGWTQTKYQRNWNRGSSS